MSKTDRYRDSLRVGLVCLLFALLSWLQPRDLLAQETSCESGISARFPRISKTVAKLQDSVSARINKDGRATRAEVEKLLAVKWDAVKKSEAGDPASARNEVATAWENDLLERTTGLGKKADYPSVAELLAFACFKSPTFNESAMEFLQSRGSVRYKVLAHFMENASEVFGTKGDVGSVGAHYWNLWQGRISLPARRIWTTDDLYTFVTEVGNAMFRSVNPEPKFRAMWLKSAIRAVRGQDSLKIWQGFTRQFTEDYRVRYTEFLKGAQLETFGTPRPEVIRDFFHWGAWDTIYRRLAAIKLLASRGNAKILEEHGLTPEDADLIYQGLLYDKLPRTYKNAMIISNHPEMYADLLYSAEVQQLSLELMFFSRPVIEGLMMYYMYFDGTLDAIKAYQDRKKATEAIKANPNILRQSQQADDDKTSNYTDQVNNLTIEVLTWQKELDAAPGMSPADRARREKDIRVAQRKIQNLNLLKQKVLDGIAKQKT